MAMHTLHNNYIPLCYVGAPDPSMGEGLACETTHPATSKSSCRVQCNVHTTSAGVMVCARVLLLVHTQYAIHHHSTTIALSEQKFTRHSPSIAQSDALPKMLLQCCRIMHTYLQLGRVSLGLVLPAHTVQEQERQLWKWEPWRAPG